MTTKELKLEESDERRKRSSRSKDKTPSEGNQSCAISRVASILKQSDAEQFTLSSSTSWCRVEFYAQLMLENRRRNKNATHVLKLEESDDSSKHS